MNRTAIALLLSMIASTSVTAEEPAPWYQSTKISWIAFGDYYDFTSHHDPAVEGQNGFWFRRLYLTFDQKISEEFSARLRFEASSAGDLKSSTSIEPFVKDAYVKWQRNKQYAVVLGLQPTPTYEAVEKVWGYRQVEKTPLDLQRMAPTRDFGIGVQGSFDKANRWRYNVLAGNGAGNNAEVNEGKQYSASLGFYPTKELVVEVYADTNELPGDEDRELLQLFAGWQSDEFRFGAQYSTQDRDKAGIESSIDIASVFGVWNAKKNLALLLRYDMVMDPNPDAAKIAYLPMALNAESNLLIAGVDWKLHKNLSIIPNVEYVTYDAKLGPDPEDTVVLRLTFYYQF